MMSGPGHARVRRRDTRVSRMSASRVRPCLQRLTAAGALVAGPLAVSAVVVDRYGFVWLATASGVVRFDERHFLALDGTRIPSLESDCASSLSLSRNGIVRVGTPEGCVARLRRLVVVDTLATVTGGDPGVVSLADDRNGRLYALTRIERAIKQQGPSDHRPVSLHATDMRPDQITRLKAVAGIPSFLFASIPAAGDVAIHVQEAVARP